jgi:hypothetical protein
MPVFTRRSFVAALSAAVPVVAFVRRAHALSVEAIVAGAPATTLRALAEVVLPSELGAERTRQVVADFQGWIDGYRQGVELTHGYGTSRLRFSGPTPATRWAGQLEALDAESRRRHRKPFADITTEPREAILREALSQDRLDRIPAVGEARHVAIALLAFFYESPAATDLCYEARIGRQTCRPLAQAGMQPVKIGTRR